MGWAPGDDKIRPELTVLTAKAREAFYSLRSKINEIKHTEKRVAMINALDDCENYMAKAYEELYTVDSHLNR